jgi:hypothetical protein
MSLNQPVHRIAIVGAREENSVLVALLKQRATVGT